MQRPDLIITPKIILPRLVVRERIPPPAKVGMTLEPQTMHWQIIGPDGRVVREADQACHNLVLDNAKELVATLGLFEQSEWAVIGTGSTAPNPSQTGLVNERARTNQTGGPTDSTTEVSTGVWEITRYRQFTAAQVGGQNLTEWGFSGSGTAGNNLMSRELFRDGSNNPVTLTLDSDQQLRLIYKVRVTVGPTTPQTASMNITGIGNRTGQFVLQQRIITGAHGYNANPVQGLSSFARAANPPKWIYGFQRRTLGYGDAFWDINNMVDFAGAYEAYTANSQNRKMSPAVRSVTEVNGTIVGIGMNENHAITGPYPRMYFQFDVGQEITKDNLHELTIAGFEISWT
ncbi:hypothetical protein [Meiothermus sp. CFH 77666]|uniref:hypothetical protein n=1 Tax=Meiothermus sp. CFH 77666 TaxID=2817942 RepID=UPI001AA013A0|nr:hypothetical protein [Meiothermus sp. CFH 77666]MBO1438345.1 hypothetical protein [Meiothermus sp. CFH 77666]